MKNLIESEKKKVAGFGGGFFGLLRDGTLRIGVRRIALTEEHA
jgi:hypothetical protein